MVKHIFLPGRDITRNRREGEKALRLFFFDYLNRERGNYENRTDYGRRSDAGDVYCRSHGCDDGAGNHL